MTVAVFQADPQFLCVCVCVVLHLFLLLGLLFFLFTNMLDRKHVYKVNDYAQRKEPWSILRGDCLLVWDAGVSGCLTSCALHGMAFTFHSTFFPDWHFGFLTLRLLYMDIDSTHFCVQLPLPYIKAGWLKIAPPGKPLAPHCDWMLLWFVLDHEALYEVWVDSTVVWFDSTSSQF